MEDCIFCKIANGEIPSRTLYEDDEFRVILDLGPATRGHALILPKDHAADIYELPEETSQQELLDIIQKLNQDDRYLYCAGRNRGPGNALLLRCRTRLHGPVENRRQFGGVHSLQKTIFSELHRFASLVCHPVAILVSMVFNHYHSAVGLRISHFAWLSRNSKYRLGGDKGY